MIAGGQGRQGKVIGSDEGGREGGDKERGTREDGDKGRGTRVEASKDMTRRTHLTAGYPALFLSKQSIEI